MNATTDTTEPSINDAEQNLTRAFKMVAQCGLELNGLIATLDDLIVSEIKQFPAEIGCIEGDEKQKVSNLNDASEWLMIGYSNSFPLSKSRGRRKTSNWLSYQISLIGDGVLKNATEPLLHISLWDYAISLKDEDCVAFPMDVDPSDRIEEGRLIAWSPDNTEYWGSRSWTYSLRLMELHDRASLVRHVVEPVIALLKREDTKKALPDDLPALVMYPADAIKIV